MTKLVISAVNLIEGGTLQVLRDCVKAAARLHPHVKTTVLAHDRSLLDEPDIEIIEMPKPKRSWWRRVKAEYWDFKEVSRKLKADIWLSLHDMTPNVIAGKQYVYCHNPSPFYRLSLRKILLDPGFAMFNAFYSLLYSINIRKNAAVIVQQEWLRQEFMKRYSLRNVVTAAPYSREVPEAQSDPPQSAGVFLYPAFPRVFKNFEVICEAAKKLSAAGNLKAEVRFTISGDENRYARWIAELASEVPAIRLIGRVSPEEMARQYEDADVVLFPSALETWGLPISEAKARGKIIMLADLPYARTTLGLYDRAILLDPHDPSAWATSMAEAIAGKYRFSRILPEQIDNADFPDWDSLMSWLTTADHAAEPKKLRAGLAGSTQRAVTNGGMA